MNRPSFHVCVDSSSKRRGALGIRQQQASSFALKYSKFSAVAPSVSTSVTVRLFTERRLFQWSLSVKTTCFTRSPIHRNHVSEGSRMRWPSSVHFRHRSSAVAVFSAATSASFRIGDRSTSLVCYEWVLCIVGFFCLCPVIHLAMARMCCFCFCKWLIEMISKSKTRLHVL